MDLIFSAWHPSDFNSGQPAIVPPNFGGLGGMIPFNWTRRAVYSLNADNHDPHIPQWNRLIPIVWDEWVITPEEEHALQQAGLVQIPGITPATYSQPGAASVGHK